jgi:hypothetical protein
MAKKKKEEVEVVEPIVVKPRKPKANIKYYPLKKRLKVSGEWREIGDKIGLTIDSYKEYKLKK